MSSVINRQRFAYFRRLDEKRHMGTVE